MRLREYVPPDVLLVHKRLMKSSSATDGVSTGIVLSIWTYIHILILSISATDGETEGQSKIMRRINIKYKLATQKTFFLIHQCDVCCLIVWWGIRRRSDGGTCTHMLILRGIIATDRERDNLQFRAVEIVVWCSQCSQKTREGGLRKCR